MSNNNKNDKAAIGLTIVGHVDSGKSTLSGRLLFELGGFNAKDLRKLQREAQELGKESFLFAFFMDKHKDERERGVTIQCTTREFFTQSYHYSITDAPGHRDFIKNMMSGSCQADVALLIVPANHGGFETSIAKGNHKKGELEGQSRAHARLCHLFGIEQIIVGINKMDDKSVNYCQKRFNEIKHEVDKMLTKIGYKTKRIPFIPMSAFKGDNICSSSSNNMPWYKGFQVKIKKKQITGITLMDALETVVRVPKRELDKPFRMPICNVYKIKGVGDVVVGKVEQGKIEPGVDVRFWPSGVKGKAFSIETFHKNKINAIAGDQIGVNVKGLSKNHMPHSGDVMCIDNPKLDANPPRGVLTFRALVFVQKHPGKLHCSQPDKKTGGFKGGFTTSVHVRTGVAPYQMISIQWKCGKSTKNKKCEYPPYIETGDQAEVTFMAEKRHKLLSLTTFDEFKSSNYGFK